ncbi:excalibur calcium-binding domain-containing protein [Camelimonas abortus]
MISRTCLLVIVVTTLATAPAMARGCKSMSSCKEAVQEWCAGYHQADRDGDGIPCENVCKSRKQVEAIQKQIGCER